MSMFGSDFFKILQLVIGILRMFGRIFGDDEDKKNDDEATGNHSHEADTIIETTPAAKRKPLNTV